MSKAYNFYHHCLGWVRVPEDWKNFKCPKCLKTFSIYDIRY